MVRIRSSAIAILIIASILMAATLLTSEPAFGEGSPADRALAQRFGRPGLPLDPVLTALSESRLVRNVAGPLPGKVDLPAVSFGYALTGAQLASLDVTGTPEATREVDAFLTRLRSRGIKAADTKWTVYILPPVQEALEVAARRGAEDQDPLGSSLIVPAGTAVELVGAVFENDQLHVKTTVSASASSSSGQRDPMRATPSSSLSWQPNGGGMCLDRQQNSTAHYDPCQRFYKLQNDGDPSYDYWASEMHGTGKSHSVWFLNGLEVDSRRKDGSAHQDWVDWDPGADGKQNCSAQTVSVSYAGASVGIEKQHCELWDIDKGAYPFDMSNWWRGHVNRSERQTAAVTATRTKAGEVPQGDFDFDFYADANPR